MLLLLALTVSCLAPTNPGGGGGGGNKFKINGIFVRDANLTSNKDKASFVLIRNDTIIFKLAALTIDTFKVDTTVSSNYFRQSPPDFLRPGQSHTVSAFHTPTQLNFSTSLFLPDTFSISLSGPNIQPDHQNPGAGSVIVNWTGSARADGYLIACVHETFSPETSFFAASGNSVPQEAFRQAGNPVSGLYKIYVVSFRGGLFPYSGMPFPLPLNYTPTDTNYTSTVTGRIGAAFVSKLDTVRIP